VGSSATALLEDLQEQEQEQEQDADTKAEADASAGVGVEASLTVGDDVVLVSENFQTRAVKASELHKVRVLVGATRGRIPPKSSSIDPVLIPISLSLYLCVSVCVPVHSRATRAHQTAGVRAAARGHAHGQQATDGGRTSGGRTRTEHPASIGSACALLVRRVRCRHFQVGRHGRGGERRGGSYTHSQVRLPSPTSHFPLSPTQPQPPFPAPVVTLTSQPPNPPIPLYIPRAQLRHRWRQPSRGVDHQSTGRHGNYHHHHCNGSYTIRSAISTSPILTHPNTHPPLERNATR